MRIELNQEGIAKVLKSPEVVAELERMAHRIAATAGEGMEVLPPEIGKKRARVAVFTRSFSARYREAKERALTRALDAGR